MPKAPDGLYRPVRIGRKVFTELKLRLDDSLPPEPFRREIPFELPTRHAVSYMGGRRFQAAFFDTMKATNPKSPKEP
jgi:hypothetical protein